MTNYNPFSLSGKTILVTGASSGIGRATAIACSRMKANVVYKEDMPFKKTSNIVSMVKIGDHVNIGDPLIRYNTAFDDAEIAKYLNKLSADNKLAFEDELKTDSTSPIQQFNQEDNSIISKEKKFKKNKFNKYIYINKIHI